MVVKTFLVATTPNRNVEFRKKSRAIEFAKKKSTKTGRGIEIDRLTRYPKAKPGQVDFSQTTIAKVTPTKITTYGFSKGKFRTKIVKRK